MTYDLGQFQMRLKGDYNASTTYQFLDVVYYNGGSYCCKSNGTTGRIPTNTTYWQQIAAAGQTTLTPAQKAEIVAALVEQQGIVIDPDYNQFSTEEKQKLADLNDPNNATLTLQVNHRTVGTFTSDSSTDTTVNIPVPTDYIKSSAVTVITEGEADIAALKFGAVYVLTAPTSVKITAFSDELEAVSDYFTTCNDSPTYLYICPQQSLTMTLPPNSLIVRGVNLTLNANVWYRVVCRAAVWEVQMLETVS